MEGMQGLGTGLATLVHALDGRKVALLEELRRVERDLEAARQTLDAAQRMGFGSAASSSLRSSKGMDFPVQATATPWVAPEAPSPASSTRHQDTPRAAEVIQMPARSITQNFEVHRTSLATLGPVRNDKAIPPEADARGRRVETLGMPTGGTELQAIKDSLKAVAERAATAPRSPGDRRRKSVRGMVPGEHMTPTLRNILRASDRPLTSLEVTVAFMHVRGVQLEGRDLTALTNRVSSLLVQEAGKGRVKRQSQDGTRLKRWTWIGGNVPEPSGLPG